MPLFITFGINGCGKDTIATNILKQRPDIVLLSGSRIMLKGLGYDVGIEVNSPVTKEMYDHLESIPARTKEQMADEVFKNVLLEFKNTNKIGILSSHLVIAKREGHNILYEQNLVRSWFPEVFDGFVFIKGDPSQIYLRHIKDKQANTRDRGLSTIESLTNQQELSLDEWAKLVKLVPTNKVKMISNLDGLLDQSSLELLNFIIQRIG